MGTINKYYAVIHPAPPAPPPPLQFTAFCFLWGGGGFCPVRQITVELRYYSPHVQGLSATLI